MLSKLSSNKIMWCLLACLLCLSSCDKVEEGDRLVVVKETPTEPDTPVNPNPGEPEDYFAETPRHVLIEDFTGQDCINCPFATDLISQLQAFYGHDLIVPVGIHCGPLGIQQSKDPQGLATPLGDEYYKHWNIEMQPMGVINRSDGVLSTDFWNAKTSYELFEDNERTKPRIAPLNIWLNTTLDGQDTTIEVTLAARQAVSGKLQLWLTEDGIIAKQKMPDGSENPLYVHNHVLRAAVNGDWGEDVKVGEQEKLKLSFKCHLDSRWKPENMSVVAFVYNTNGVVQAGSRKLKIDD